MQFNSLLISSCLSIEKTFALSAGGFLAAQLFAQKNSDIIQLHLLSPAGFNPVGAIEFEAKRNAWIERMPYLKKILVKKVVDNIYVQKYSPFEMFYLPSFFWRFLFSKYWNSPRFKMQPEEASLFIEVQTYFISLPQHGERCLGYLLQNGVKSDQPIIDILASLPDQHNKITLYYGEKDWMDIEHTLKSLQTQHCNLKINYIQEAEHQLIFQNPKHITDIMVSLASPLTPAIITET